MNYTLRMLLFDVLPVWAFLAFAAAGILVGFGLRVWLHARSRRGKAHSETRQERFEFLAGTLSQSAAIGLALTFAADVVLAARETEPLLLAGLMVLIAAGTSFAAAFLREVIRKLFYR